MEVDSSALEEFIGKGNSEGGGTNSAPGVDSSEPTTRKALYGTRAVGPSKIEAELSGGVVGLSLGFDPVGGVFVSLTTQKIRLIGSRETSFRFRRGDYGWVPAMPPAHNRAIPLLTFKFLTALGWGRQT